MIMISLSSPWIFFQVLDDKTGELVVLRAVVSLFQLLGKIGIRCRHFIQCIFDRMLLLLAEGDDADTLPGPRFSNSFTSRAM